MQKRKIDGEKVERLRNELWLNQTELAQKAGVSMHTISRMETGVHEYPRRSTIFAVAEALGVRPEELLLSDPLPLPEPSPDEGESRTNGVANGIPDGHSRRTG